MTLRAEAQLFLMADESRTPGFTGSPAPMRRGWGDYSPEARAACSITAATTAGFET